MEYCFINFIQTEIRAASESVEIAHRETTDIVPYTCDDSAILSRFLISRNYCRGGILEGRHRRKTEGNRFVPIINLS